MKRLFIPLAAVAVLAASCAKDYACTCTETETFAGQTDTQTYTSPTYQKVTKKWMKNTAECVSSSYTEGDYSYTADCKIEKK